MAGEEPGEKPDRASGPRVKVFQCPGCGSAVTLRAEGQSLVVTCSSCKSTIDVANENFKILEQYTQMARVEPVLPLGRKGKLRGETWMVIGFMKRGTPDGAYNWEEYLLFNPYKGFRWLNASQGHWTLWQTTRNRPTESGRTADFLGRTYQLYTEGQARVGYVMGEFYWRVKLGDTVRTSDYIHPPYCLSKERDEEETNWSHGEYIHREELRAAFGSDLHLPPRYGVAPNQPSPRASYKREMLLATAFFALLLVVIQWIQVHRATDKVVGGSPIRFVYGKPNDMVERITLEPGLDNLAIDFDAPQLSNTWLDIEGTLVSDTGESYEFQRTLEYYSGYDGGESWSEGSKNTTIVLPNVPPGEYDLSLDIDGATDASTYAKPANNIPVQIQVRRSVATWWNFFTSLFLLAIVPGLYWIRERQFEMSRWSDSEFNPYDTEEG